MAKVTNTGDSALKLIKPKYIVATLFTGSDTNVPSGDSYILEDVVRDTTSISQDDNETTDIERETSDTPIKSIVTLGSWQLSAEVADTNGELLAGLCGFVYDSTNKKAYAPSSYEERYAKVDVAFTNPKDNAKLSAFVLPKVQLNSKMTIESLNTNLGRIALAGTAQLVKVTANGKQIDVPFYVEEEYTLPTAD
jgi:hypothetical protein